MQFFLYKQNILLLYVIMSFGNFNLFKSYAWFKYMFCMKNGFENVYYKDQKLWRYHFVFFFVKLET